MDHTHTTTAVVPEMLLAARFAVGQGWCTPDTERVEMNPPLAEAISQSVARPLSFWYNIAAQHHRNEEYYRGLVRRIGTMLGAEAYRADDGSQSDDVLCAKVPDLVAALVARVPAVETPTVEPAGHPMQQQPAIPQQRQQQQVVGGF